MRLKPVLLLLALALGAGLIVLAVSLRNGVSLDLISSYVEARGSEILGRQLVLGEAPRIQIKSGLQLTVNKLSLADADWAGEEDMLELRSLEAHIDLSTLFRDQLVLETLIVDGLRLKLRRSADNQSNLPQLGNDKSADNAKNAQHPLPVIVRHIEIKNVLLDHINDASDQNIRLKIDALSQDTNKKESLSYRGKGSFQGKPWNLSISGSGFSSLRSGQNLSADFNVGLGELQLQGDFHMPDAREIQNLRLNAQLNGPIPERIAALSPLLEPGETTKLLLRVSDVDPGLRVNLDVKLNQLEMQLSGDIDDPRSSDGLNLAIQLNAASLPRVAQAFGLKETHDVPLSLDGTLLRHDKRIELRDLALIAGDHQIRGDIVLPAFPGTNDATVNLSAVGPDTGLYHGLFGRRADSVEPYRLNATILSSARGESVDAELRVGEHTLQLSGLLDNFPSYAGSDLTLKLDSPSLQAIAANADISLPSDTPLSIRAALSISQEAVITVNSASIGAYEATGSILGTLDSYPDFDNIDLQIDSQVPSLAVLGEHFGLRRLTELPLTISAAIDGNLQAMIVNDLRLVTGGLNIQSKEGSIRYSPGAIRSDLHLSVAITDVHELLGGYATAHIPPGAYRFDLLPQMSSSLFLLGLENLQGPGVSGSARLELANDFQINEKTQFTADLQLQDMSKLLPSVDGYTAPREPLFLRSVTRSGDKATQIDARLSDDKNELLAIKVGLSQESTQDAINVTVIANGDDFRKFGNHQRLPNSDARYAINLSASINGQDVALQARNIELGGTRVHGVANWNHSLKSLTADLQVPEANFQQWLGAKEPATADRSAAKDKRKIPATPLPLNLLHDYRIDLSLETGPLGIMDPKFKTRSLVDESRLRLLSGEGRGHLKIHRIQGSRGSFVGEASIVDAKPSAHVETELSIRGLPLALVGASTKFAELPKYDVTSTLNAQGNNLRSLAATLNGDFLMTGSSGTLKKMKLSVATESFVAQLLKTLLPPLANGSTNMEVECSVLAARARNGVVALDPGLVFRSAQIDLLAAGKIDLRDERLRIDFNNRARQGLGISAASLINPYVKITGTLSKPALGLDITGSAISGGAAVATGGMTLLAKPLYHRFVQKQNPCEAALKRWEDSAG